jgi:hypothetical protein
MTSLKDHQNTMVTLLASGTAIPTSAIRLAHAVHDILAKLNDTQEAPVAHTERRSDSTTSGLNDAMLAVDVAAVAPKQQSLESLLKQRDNTIRQLKDRVADLVKERDHFREQDALKYEQIQQMLPEQAGCRKQDTQCRDDVKFVGEWLHWSGGVCPVEGDTEVAVHFRSGAYHCGLALGFEWEHHNAWLDVTAYRVVDK